jgi:16S rRNA (guanine966-N2)-methyltransferase
MRVIAGLYGGRKISPPANIPTRPTTDFAKTGLFNILNNHIDFADVSCLELFAGTGSLSLEMASRGCTDLVAVDENHHCVSFIQKTARDWYIAGLHAVKADAFGYIARCDRTFDIVIADPPYALPNIESIPDKILTKPLLNAGGILVVETSPKTNFDLHPLLWHRRNYGTTVFHFFKMPE